VVTRLIISKLLPAIVLSLVAVTALPFISIVSAQTQSTLPRLHVRLEKWTTEDGLPGETVKSIIQTRDGYLWIGTQAGIARFDGVKFTVFDQNNVKELRGTECSVLLEGRGGELWIGTIGGGLTKYEGGKFTTFGQAEGLASDAVNGLYEDRSRRLFITSYGKVTVRENGRFTIVNPPEDVIYAFPFYDDDEGRVWVFNAKGVNFNNSGILSFYKDGKFFSGKEVESQFPIKVNQSFYPFGSRKGTLWTHQRDDDTLVRFQDGHSVVQPFGLAKNETMVRAAEDSSGNLWIGSTLRKIYRWFDGHLMEVLVEDAAPLTSIYVIYPDREGNVWIGSNDGLRALKSKAFDAYSTAEGLSNERCWTIFEDSRGDIWIGTDIGLNRWRNGKFDIFHRSDGLVGESVLSVAEDKQGQLWLATTGGLGSFKDGQFKSYHKEDGLLDDNVRSVYVDRDNRLWVGSVGGLQSFENGVFKSYTTKEGLSQNSIMSTFQDSSGALWVATTNGLNRFRNDRFEVFRKENGLSSNIVISAAEESDGVIWFGTVGGGVVRFKNEKFTAITNAAGLPDDTITRILKDDDGDLWMGCLRGVFRVTQQELNAVADGKQASVTCVLYGKADGILSTDISGGPQPAGWRTNDGRMVFPTAKGIAVVDPRKLLRNSIKPPVFIEDFIVDRSRMGIFNVIGLPAGSRAMEFQYTALSYVHSTRVKFKYMLEGWDHEWVDAGERRVAIYTNLPPGDYKFRVIAANNDGVWNDEGASLSFVLLPYFFQTMWFFFLCAASMVALAWAVYRLRLRQIKREFEAVLTERNRIARELHDSLAQGFTSVSMQLEATSAKLVTAPDSARDHLNQARLLVRSSLAEARRTVRDLRSEHLDGADLSVALKKVAQQLMAGTDTKIDVRASGELSGLSDQIEGALLRVGQEALTNAIKYAQASQIDVRISRIDGKVELTIADNGCGFDPQSGIKSSNGGGFGLPGMKERVSQINGELSIESAVGKGTRIYASVPVIRKDKAD